MPSSTPSSPAARLRDAKRLLPAVLAASICLLGGSAVQAQSASELAGLWRTQTEGGTVRIAACGSAICGTVVGSPRLRANPDQRDSRNADPALRDRRLQGLTMLRMEQNAAGRWENGWVYNPEDGKTYRGSIQLTPEGQLRLTGCVVRPLCRTQTWTRAN